MAPRGPCTVSSTASNWRIRDTYERQDFWQSGPAGLQSIRNWKSFQRERFWQKEKEGTLFCSSAAHGHKSEPLRMPPGMELAQPLNSNIPSLPSLWNCFCASEIFQTSTQGTQVFCSPQFRKNNLFPTHRLTLSFSVYFKAIWVAIFFLEAANGRRIGVQEAGVKGILHLVPSISKTDTKVYIRPNLEYRTPKEKQ